MRRIKQLLPTDEAKKILYEGSHGVLSLICPDGKPYGVPVNYVYDGESRIYFHSATKGLKIECIAADPHGSFCVIGQDRIIPEEFTSYFRSVIVNGHINIITEETEIIYGLTLLCEKYSPGIDPSNEISSCVRHVALLRLDIEAITGKEAIELVRQRKGNG